MKQPFLKICLFCLLPLTALLATSCKDSQQTPVPKATTIDYANAVIPSFSADSAYRFVKEQLDCGYRSPNSKGHSACCQYLAQQMKRFCDTVYLQDFNATLWDGTAARGTNIIASLNPAANHRILLGAHWDSRLWADHDSDPSNHKKPIMGANDGASGVGVLMEMARSMSLMPPAIGVDFIFFDLEDQGVPEWADEYQDHTWCLGSQYWARNKHVPYYQALYGILLDMVGSREPRFTKEGFSMQYAPGITNKLWRTAAALGYGNIFIDLNTDPILDDHMYVNQLGGLPMLDIVQNSLGTSFFTHWHTVGDNLDCIDKNTLNVVATVVLKTIYGDYPATSQPITESPAS